MHSIGKEMPMKGYSVNVSKNKMAYEDDRA